MRLIQEFVMKHKEMFACTSCHKNGVDFLNKETITLFSEHGLCPD